MKAKPAKPYRDFPLTAHANGQWCKIIRGKVHFFGVWNDPDAALQKYLDERDDLQAGRQPQWLSDGPDLAALCNEYLARRDTGEISPRTFDEYHDACKLMVRR